MKQRFIIIKLIPSDAFYPYRIIEVIGEFRPDELSLLSSMHNLISAVST